MLLQRASALFDRYVTWVPFVVAFVKRWPTQFELSWPMHVGESWQFLLSLLLYTIGTTALSYAAAFAQQGLDA